MTRAKTSSPILILIAALLIELAGPACQPAPVGHYVNKKRAFELTFPADWEVMEAKSEFDVIGFSKNSGPRDEFQENVAIASTQMKFPIGPDQILDQNQTTLEKIVTDFKVIERGHQNIGGVPAAWVRYTQTMGAFKLIATLYAVPGRDRAYLIYTTAEAKTFEEFKPLFTTIVESFRVI